MYLDANNLYGWAMSEYLPVDGFRWLSDNEIKQMDVDGITDNNDKGYILEVDLEYPTELHDLHNDYPLAPENIKISDDMLSKYCKSLKKKFHLGTSDGHT